MIKQHKTHSVWDSDGWMDIEEDKDWLDFVKEEYPDIYKDKDRLTIKNIADKENYQAHKDMHDAFDYWYGADGVFDYLEGTDATVVYDGNKWDWSV